MKALNISVNTFKIVHKPPQTWFVEKVEWRGESVELVILCAAKIVGSDVVVSTCVATKSELTGFDLIVDNRCDSEDDATAMAISTLA